MWGKTYLQMHRSLSYAAHTHTPQTHVYRGNSILTQSTGRTDCTHQLGSTVWFFWYNLCVCQLHLWAACIVWFLLCSHVLVPTHFMNITAFTELGLHWLKVKFKLLLLCVLFSVSRAVILAAVVWAVVNQSATLITDATHMMRFQICIRSKHYYFSSLFHHFNCATPVLC